MHSICLKTLALTPGKRYNSNLIAAGTRAGDRRRSGRPKASWSFGDISVILTRLPGNTGSDPNKSRPDEGAEQPAGKGQLGEI